MSASVLNAVRAAVQNDPQDVALRVHLAGLLIDADEPAEALDQCVFVLANVPDERVAIEYAVSACEALGLDDRAASYRRLQVALRGESVEQPPMGEVVRLHALAQPDDMDGPDLERPLVTLADVGGMEAVKRRLQVAFIAPLENPALRRMYGKSLRGGLLLYGPPGCGKTFIARALAGQLGARFLAVGLHDVLGIYFGESQQRLHAIFDEARRAAPTVLFFDEVDALGRRRSQLRTSVGRDVVAQFLAELDNVDHGNEGVFVLGATNHPWDVDSALRRPGRFDRTLLVTPPDRSAREAILASHLRDRPVDDSIDIAAIAARTRDYSGADLAHVCETAAEFALLTSIETGDARPIDQDDMMQALADVKSSTGAWLETARNYAQFASDDGAYDDLLAYLRERHD